MHPPSHWLAHSQMTEPGNLSSSFARLPSNVASLNQVVQGLLMHCQWLDKYNDDPAAFGPISRSTLPVNERLAALLKRDGQKLDEARTPTQRGIGTCRDFALTLCAFLRAPGTAARLRCGFASYFGETWEDHWVCEYWNDHESRWCLSDAQLDEVIQASCGVTFNPSNVPRDAFLTAGEAWLRCRAGSDKPEWFGQGDTKGLWFMKVNVVRDAFAVNNRETSSWDRWREAPPELRTVSPDEVATLDRTARHPEDAVELTPPWLVDAA
jgi:Transglutaminase-like superfamily